jgi:hypothetical protein
MIGYPGIENPPDRPVEIMNINFLNGRPIKPFPRRIPAPGNDDPPGQLHDLTSREMAIDLQRGPRISSSIHLLRIGKFGSFPVRQLL